ncbi:unnamed protein product, partial [Microthlaspi erraticum]
MNGLESYALMASAVGGILGQLMLLCLSLVYDRYLKTLPMRPLIHIVQLHNEKQKRKHNKNQSQL